MKTIMKTKHKTFTVQTQTKFTNQNVIQPHFVISLYVTQQEIAGTLVVHVQSLTKLQEDQKKKHAACVAS